MRYKPRPTPGAACYDGLLALRGFGPNPADAADVLEACALCTYSEGNASSSTCATAGLFATARAASCLTMLISLCNAWQCTTRTHVEHQSACTAGIRGSSTTM